MAADMNSTVVPAVRSRRGRHVRRLYVGVVVAGAAALVAGVAFALTTVTVNLTGTGSAPIGSVTLGSPASTTCAYANLVPGDLTGSGTCSFAITYTGSLDAYLSLSLQIQSKSGSGGTSLYDGTNTSGLSLSISDGQNTYTVPVGGGTVGGSCPATYRCWTSSNDLAAWYDTTSSPPQPNLTFDNGKAVTFTATPIFPTAVGNQYQGATATLTLTAQAVQAGANTLPAGCDESKIGKPCPASGSFTWS